MTAGFGCRHGFGFLALGLDLVRLRGRIERCFSWICLVLWFELWMLLWRCHLGAVVSGLFVVFRLFGILGVFGVMNWFPDFGF